MNNNSFDGIEIPYALESIEQIDPGIVGHVTLFTKQGDSINLAERAKSIRELLIADYLQRSPETYPETVMYSGSR